jgi:hypothetical protein
MKFCKYGLFLMALVLATGCTITAPGVKIKAPLSGVEIEMDAGHGGGFCPPGQAKKGNC